MRNVWRLENSGLAQWPDLALMFDVSGYDIASQIAANPGKAVLLRQGGGTYDAVSGVSVVYDAGSGVLAFGCPSGVLSDGIYTVGVASPNGMMIIVL